MSETNTSSSSGIGFAGLLTIVFIVLKLTGYITWPWVWVISPLWISAALAITILVVVLIVAIFLEYKK
jgi:NADH:ubiquinone oxidoreductase subunit 3 (subunit A)